MLNKLFFILIVVFSLSVAAFFGSMILHGIFYLASNTASIIAGWSLLVIIGIWLLITIVAAYIGLLSDR